MTATVQVHCGKSPFKEIKDRKDIKEISKERKDLKDGRKEFKELKELPKELKELSKERKDLKDRVEGKSLIKDFQDGGGGKGPKELVEWPGGWPGGFGEWSPAGGPGPIAQLEERIATLEAAMGLGGGGGEGEAFIGSQLRPDLIGAPDYSGQGDLQQRMASGDRDAKLAFDTPPSR